MTYVTAVENQTTKFKDIKRKDIRRHEGENVEARDFSRDYGAVAISTDIVACIHPIFVSNSRNDNWTRLGLGLSTSLQSPASPAIALQPS